jgi:hypothetical protein
MAALLAVAAFLLVPSMAGGQNRLEVQDPRDGTPPLDVKEVDSNIEKGGLRFTVVTWSRWSTRAIVDRAYVVVHLDPRTGRRYYVLLRSDRRRMVAILYRKGRAARLGRLKAWRADRRSASVLIPAKKLKLGPAGSQYAWRVQTLVTRERRCARVCFDDAPDGGDAVATVPAG